MAIRLLAGFPTACFCFLLLSSEGCRGGFDQADGFSDRDDTQEMSSSCQNEMITIQDQYCIDRNFSPATSWHNASDSCLQAGKTLCTMERWSNACLIAPEGLIDMVTIPAHGEWVSDYVDGVNGYKMWDGCEIAHLMDLNASYPFRCCKDL